MCSRNQTSVVAEPTSTVIGKSLVPTTKSRLVCISYTFQAKTLSPRASVNYAETRLSSASRKEPERRQVQNYKLPEFDHENLELEVRIRRTTSPHGPLIICSTGVDRARVPSYIFSCLSQLSHHYFRMPARDTLLDISL